MFVFLKKLSPLFLMVFISIGVYLYLQEDKYIKGNKIKLLEFADLSGFNRKRSENFNAGMEAYFKYVNEKGGIFDRNISLIKIDSKGEIDYAIEDVEKSLNEILSFFGVIDFCSSKRILELFAKNTKPLIMPFSPAAFLKKEYEGKYYFITPTIEDEINAFLDYLESQEIRSFSIICEDNLCMRTILKEVENFSKDRRMEIEDVAFYKKNTYLLSKAYEKLSVFYPKAVLTLGSYKEIGNFIKRAVKGEKFAETLFLVPSYVGIDAFLEEIKDIEEVSFIFSQPVFSPFEDKIILKDYRKIMKTYFPEEKLGFDSLKGFLYAKIFILGLENVGERVSGEKILNSLKKIPYIKYNRENLIKAVDTNGMLNKIYLFKYTNKKIFMIDQER